MKKWIQKAINPKTKGKLRSELHAKPGKKIPKKTLDRATHSKNPTLRREAILAETLRKTSHRKRKTS